MIDLINAVIDSEGTVGAFPIIEYWRDVGTHNDLTEIAQAKFLADTTNQSVNHDIQLKASA